MKNIFILITVCTVGYTQCLGDMNRDGIKDVLDIFILVDDILDGNGVCDTITEVCVDIDGNFYSTVQIGNQLWMSENLKTTRYNNGDEIPTGLTDGEWQNTTSGALAVYDDNESNADIYGRLYNWYALVDNRGVCPENFHVPTDEEYTQLTIYLGGSEVAGGKMKEAGLEHWNSPNAGATNESGFSGFPGGFRNISGSYVYVGNDGYFRSSSEYSTSQAWYHSLHYGYSVVYQGFNMSKQSGLSVRCVGD
tara:strand:+ start:10 stop:759 length:750 start_codon:yes stop_codon:yes gene_type:complete